MSGAEFTIHQGSHNGTPLEIVDNDGNRITTFKSESSGVFYVGELNYGTYYIEETKAPTSPEGYSKPAEGKYFIVTVNEDGVGYLKDGKLGNEATAVSPQ